MNLGFSGPIAARKGVVVKDRIGRVRDELGHLHRASELRELLGIEGGILMLARGDCDDQFGRIEC